MAQSLSKLYIHIIFHIQLQGGTPIRKEDFEQLYAYIIKVIDTEGCRSVCIGGTETHLHILSTLSRNETVAKLVEEIKRHSSRWLSQKDGYYRYFHWQKGYAVFSVSQSVVDKCISYIQGQEQHHKKVSFQDELIAFLKEYGVDYNEEYLFRD